MFDQGSGPGLRAFIFLIFSLALIVLDQRSVFFHSFRTRFSASVAYPFQSMVDSPIRFMNWLNAGVTRQDHLVHENEELRVREILLESRLQKLLALEKENAQLRQLLKSTSDISGRVSVARLLAVSLDPNLQEVVLNKGAKDKVYQGQPVLDGFGVMGQVVGVGPFTSKVLLITDKQSAVPVEDYRDGTRAIAVGTGVAGQLALINTPDMSDIQDGDLFVTSGLGLCYPIGYPVGTVTKIEHAHNAPVEKVLLTPAAHLNQTEQVLLAWPSKSKLAQAVQRELQNDNTDTDTDTDTDADADANTDAHTHTDTDNKKTAAPTATKKSKKTKKKKTTAATVKT